MTREAGSHFVIGYGGTVEILTIDIISTERNVIGNIVGTSRQSGRAGWSWPPRARSSCTPSRTPWTPPMRRLRRPRERPGSPEPGPSSSPASDPKSRAARQEGSAR